MIILAIETSCDDTCAAVVKIKGRKNPSFEILSNIVSSQVEIHRKYGGVYPSLAKREHQKNLPIVFQKVLKEAKNPDINLIGVTNGPGLEPCLWVGINFAIEQAKKLKLPLVPVNHIEAHIFANLLPQISSNLKLLEGEPSVPYGAGKTQNLFPAICLVVSGGHTQLILMRGFGRYKILGETRDDAAGECFDKTARILGLGYPGGPIISKLSQKLADRGPTSIRLPRPMIYQKNYDFSFSGLKTAVLYDFKNHPSKIRQVLPAGRQAKKYIREMSFEIQQAIIDVLIHKTLKAAKDYQAKTLILGGGVVANSELRKQFKERVKKEIPKTEYIIPDTKYCTDNAVMTAVTAYYHWLKSKTKKWGKIEAKANLRL